ncbi:hypothetical protein X798_01629 [Onchocerca flexuosa]|uniref:Uncharacterized protein n=1 Tax=Onchocerca flexuosa TaxID=387005 RepID=A0A238C187_9BILA|nr:hypothetical protein X798_01629 [Onchocerca flexuosa]
MLPAHYPSLFCLPVVLLLPKSHHWQQPGEVEGAEEISLSVLISATECVLSIGSKGATLSVRLQAV